MATAHTALQRPSRRARRAAALAIATAASATLFSTTAHAVVTGTSITSPAPNAVVDADYGSLIYDGETPPQIPTLTVNGRATTSGPGPHQVRVGAVIPLTLFRTAVPIAFSEEPIEVRPDGTFTAEVPVPPINARIVAVPEEFDYEDFETTFVNGTGPFQWTPVLGGGSISGELSGIETLTIGLRGQEHGFALVAPAGFASIGIPLSIGLLGGVTSGAYGDTAGDVGLSFMGTAGITDQYNAARGGVMVDGTRGFLRDHIPVGSDELPLSTVKRTVDRTSGGQTVVQTQPVYVAADPSDNPNEPPLVGGYDASGVELQRTTVQDHDGRQVSVTDRFVSADGEAHRIDVLYAEGLNLLAYNGWSPYGGDICLPFVPCEEYQALSLPPALAESNAFADPSDLPSALSGGDVSLFDAGEPPAFPTYEPAAFRIPWETGDEWETRSHAVPLSAPSSATSTVYTRLPNAARLIAALLRYTNPEGDTPEVPVTSTYGAITFGTRPDSGLFVSDPSTIGQVLGGRSTQFVARFVRDVPAGGDTTITQVYSTGTTTDEVEGLAAAAEKRLAPVAPPAPPLPIPQPPLMPPTPPAPQTPAARKTPRKLTTSSSLKRTRNGQYRFRFTGRLTLPSGVSQAACRAGGGTVAVQIKAGRNTISTRRVKLSKSCRYNVRINFRSGKRFGKRTRLTIVTKWSGNQALGPKPAKKFTVRVR